MTKMNETKRKADELALKWWETDVCPNQRANDLSLEDAYAEGLVYGWTHPLWIPVELRLPKEIGSYWCIDEDGNQAEVYWNGYGWFAMEADSCPIADITHWMERPLPPISKQTNSL